jgi:hypothetical protein
MYAYKNDNTGQVVCFAEKDPRLESLDNWKSIDASEVPASAAHLADLAAAERASIEAAAAARLDETAAAAVGTVHKAAAKHTSVPGASQPTPTLSTGAGPQESLAAALDKEHPARAVDATSFEENRRAAEAEMANPPTDGVLKRAKADHKSGATQIGDNPEEHAGPKAAKAAKGKAVEADKG